MNRRQPDPMARIFLLLLVIPVIWAAILAAPLLGEGLPGLLKGLAEIDPARLTWTADTPRIILLFLLSYGLGLLIYAASRKNYRRLEEYGSARWGDPRALCRNYADRAKPMHNKLFTRHVRMSFNGRKHRRDVYKRQAHGAKGPGRHPGAGTETAGHGSWQIGPRWVSPCPGWYRDSALRCRSKH